MVCASNRFGLRMDISFTELQNVRYLTIAEMTSKMTLREYYNCRNAHRKPTTSSPKTTGSFKTGPGERMKKPVGLRILGHRRANYPWVNQIEEAPAFKFEDVEFSKPFLVEPSVVVLSAISFGEIASIAYLRRGRIMAQ